MGPSKSSSTSPSTSPSISPSSSPSMIPTSNPILEEPTIECVDNDEITFVIKKKTKDCKWLSKKAARAKNNCEKKRVLNENGGYSKVKFACRATCKDYLPRCS